MTFIAVQCPYCHSKQVVKRGKTHRGILRCTTEYRPRRSTPRHTRGTPGVESSTLRCTGTLWCTCSSGMACGGASGTPRNTDC